MEPPQKSWWENMTNTIYNNSPEWAKQSYYVGKVLLFTDTLEQAKMLSGKALINQAGRTVTSLATLGTYEADLLTVTDLDRANGYVGAAYGARMTTEAASGAWIGQLAKTPSYLGKGLGLLDFGGNLVQTTLGTYGTVVYGPSTENTLKIVGGGSGLGGNLAGLSRWGRPDGFLRGGFGETYGRMDAEGFTPPPIFTSRHAELTNGVYTFDRVANLPHTTGSLAGGKGQFLYRVNEKQLVLDGASYADGAGLWNREGTKAKIIFDRPIGVHGKSGELSNVLNIYRTNTNFVHGSPGTPQW